MQAQPAPVVLLLADISGFTPFMLSPAKAPVHSQMIIGGLMETLVRQVDHPLRIVDLEGDALFLYAARASDSAAWDKRARHLTDRILRLFAIFDRRKAELAAYSVCRCEASRTSRRWTSRSSFIRARSSSTREEGGFTQVEFREGHAEALPVPDGWADVIIDRPRMQRRSGRGGSPSGHSSRRTEREAGAHAHAISHATAPTSTTAPASSEAPRLSRPPPSMSMPSVTSLRRSAWRWSHTSQPARMAISTLSQKV